MPSGHLWDCASASLTFKAGHHTALMSLAMLEDRQGHWVALKHTSGSGQLENLWENVASWALPWRLDVTDFSLDLCGLETPSQELLSLW